MTPDPLNAVSKAGALKDWPLWLLAGLAIAFTVMLVPPLFALVPPSYAAIIIIGAVVFWVLALAKAASSIPGLWNARRAQKLASIKLVITPIDHQCTWGISQQPDGSFVTQIAGHYVAKNRAHGPIHLMKTSVVKPKIYGEELPGVVLVKSVTGNVYGTAHVSGHAIPSGMLLPIAVTLLFRGMPKQRSGDMRVTVEFTDADGNTSRTSAKMTCLSNGPVRQSWIAKLFGK